LAEEVVLGRIFWTLSFKKHQFLIADVRQSMFLFLMGTAISAAEGPVLDVADLANTAALDAAQCAAHW
jgi:hypothetical protein